MNSAEHFDRLIDVLLREEIGGRRPPDLTGRILSRAFSRPRRLIRVWPLLAAAGILLALCGAWLLGPAYPPPETGGSLSGAALARGATCAVVGQPGFLNLGGYCRLRFEPGSEFRLEGAEWQEQIHLARGEVECEVERKRGAFTVRTEIAAVHALGTRFRVGLEAAKGGEAMRRPGISAGLCLAVAVMAGSVRVEYGGKMDDLAAGQARTFGGEELKSEDPPAIRTPGRDGEKNAVARGVVIGTVKAKGEAWVEITSLSGKTEKYIPEWQGGMPQNGGGPNRRVCEMIARVKVGDRVKAHWYVNDHLRLAAIERLNGAAEKEQEKSEKKEGAGGEADGFAGMLAGKVLERIERGIKIEVTRIAEVWKHSQARRPEALIGKKVCVRVDPGIYARKENSEKYRMLVWTFFGSLAAGQEEVFDVKHLEGDNFLFLELTEEQRQRCARLQEGGEVIGTVVAKERNWIEVKPEGDGPAERYMARWIGGAPKDGGGPDREMLAAIERIQIGDRVRVRWTFDERKRVIALERLSAAKGETPKTIPPAEGDGKKDVWDELEKALRESAR